MKTKMKCILSSLLCAVIFITSFSTLYVNAEVMNFDDSKTQVAPQDVNQQNIHEDEDGCCCCGVLDEEFDKLTTEEASDYYDKDIATTGAMTFPPSVDNSDSEYFPEIIDQGDGNMSCGPVSIAYYQFTYELNRARKVKTTKENSLSPMFVYNLINSGGNNTTSVLASYRILETVGCPTQKTFPFDNNNFRNWPCSEEAWREAMNNRLSGYHEISQMGTIGTLIKSSDDPDLEQTKRRLSEGKVLRFTAHTGGWKYDKIKANRAVSENDKYVGQQYLKYSVTNSFGHSMLIVGYNDNIWCDINNNNQVDNGEMGAFKIVNSYGKDKWNDGYLWVAYDALNVVSQVEGVEKQLGRVADVSKSIFIDVVEPYHDKEMYVKFTLKTADRSQFVVRFTNNNNKKIFLEYAKYSDKKSNFAFDGTNVATDATFVYPLRDLAPWVGTERFVSSDFSIIIEDTNKDEIPLIIKDISVVDPAISKEYSLPCDYPIVLDGDYFSKTFEEPFSISSITKDRENCVVAKPIVFESITSCEKIMSETVDRPKSRFVIKNSDGQVVHDEESECLSCSIDGKSTTTCAMFTPSEVGEYTLTVSSVDDNDRYAEKTLEFRVVDLLIGDADCNGIINVLDSTLIQKYSADYVDVSSLYLEMADCNKDTVVSILDATCIQRYIAKSDAGENIGTIYEHADTFYTLKLTDSIHWEDEGQLYCYYYPTDSYSQWPGIPMTKMSVNNYGESIYAACVPDSTNGIIFNINHKESFSITYNGGNKNYYLVDKSGTGYFPDIVEY